MLKFYFSTSVIWLIINLSLIMFYREKIMANDWLELSDSEVTTQKIVASLLIMSVVPIFRVIMAVMIVVMATYTLEEFEEWAERVKEEK